MVLLFIGGAEIFVIALFVVMFFGADKLPEIAKGLGKGMRQIKDATDDIKREIKESAGEDTISDIKAEIDSAKKTIKDVGNEAKKAGGDLQDGVPNLKNIRKAKKEVDEIIDVVDSVKGAVKRKR
jgi:sec-independent protein translocase protein TatA